MRLAEMLQLAETRALLRYQQENPWDRQARLIFTDYLRDHNLEEIADCVGRSLEMSNAVLLPDGSRFVYDGWLTQPAFEIYKGVSMEFCWIPAGKATLGSPFGERDRADGEKEYHFKTNGFWLGKYAVTQEQWKGVIGDEPSDFEGAKLPVEKVSWENCQQFISQCDLKGLKLPHEGEWEYACRGGLGNKQPFYWGGELNGDKANCAGNPYDTSTKEVSIQKTTEVGSYEKVAPHPWGLCDMSGNVFEWCENLRTPGGTARVVRGGSWCHRAWLCRSASRSELAPKFRINCVGCRLALVPFKGES